MLPNRETDVLEHAHRIEQRSVLEQHPDALADVAELALALLRQPMAGDAHVARVGPLKAADHPQQRALARPAAAEQQMDLALAHAARHAVEDLALAEREPDVAQLDEGVGIEIGAGGSGSAVRAARRRFASGGIGEAFQDRSSDSESCSVLSRIRDPN